MPYYLGDQKRGPQFRELPLLLGRVLRVGLGVLGFGFNVGTLSSRDWGLRFGAGARQGLGFRV